MRNIADNRFFVTAQVLASLLLGAESIHAQTLVAVDDAFGVPFGKPLMVENPGVLDNDTLDGAAASESGVTAEIVTGPSHGTLECPSNLALSLCPDGSFDYTPGGTFTGSDSFTYRSAFGAVVAEANVTLSACDGGPTVYTCWSEDAYLAKLTELGYSLFREGFEDGNVWGGVRSPNTAASVVSQGITWTSNYPLTNDISTSSGASHTGQWGIFDPDHGSATGNAAQCDLDVPPERCLFYDGVTGTQLASAPPLYAVGAYFSGFIGANIEFLIDGVSTGGGKLSAAVDGQFFGVVDTAGLMQFQVREIDGKIGQALYIFSDDFTFGVLPAPVWFSDVPAQVNHNWAFVDAASGYLDAVVIAGPPTYHGPDPGVVRLQNVSDLGFELRFQEWDYRFRDFGDTYHAMEDIPYVVLQPGRHTMSDGSVWEVGSFPLGGTRTWQGELFTQSFSQAPKVFLTVQTNNDNQAVSVRAQNITVDGFQAALFEEEALNDGHVSETVGYLAIESPAGGGLIDLDGVQVPYLLQSLSGDERWSPVLSQRLKVEEEQSRGAEVGHVDETLQVLALGHQVFAQQISNYGGDTTALRRLEPIADPVMEWGVVRGVDHDWQTLPFAKRYVDPIIVAKPASNKGGDPGVIRLQSLTGTHAQLRYQEWNYRDGWHVPEDVFYMISEAGQRSLGGLRVEAGRLVTNKLGYAGQWKGLALNTPFVTAPVVLASVMTYNGADTVTTRIRNLVSTGFEIVMDEQESKADGHVNETLGWIAIEQGSGTTAEGRNLEVFFEQLDHVLTSVPYPTTSHRHPTVLGDVDSTYETDPVFLRYANPTNAQIELKLAEEQSLDAETSHVVEDVGVFVGE